MKTKIDGCKWHTRSRSSEASRSSPGAIELNCPISGINLPQEHIIFIAIHHTCVISFDNINKLQECKQKTAILWTCLLSLFLLEGGSIGGMATGVLTEDLLGGTTVDERTDIEGLPADVERTEVVCSTKFRPN